MTSEDVVTFALLSSALAGCLPIPHSQRESPALTGHVSFDGSPVAGAVVKLDVNKPECVGASSVAQTDAEGRYSFPAQSYIDPVFAFGDKRDSWSVCAQIGGRAVTNRGHGYWGGPARQQLDLEGKSTGTSAAPATSAP